MDRYIIPPKLLLGIENTQDCRGEVLGNQFIHLVASRAQEIPLPETLELPRSAVAQRPRSPQAEADRVADPELKSTPRGKSVATFRLATNRVWTDQQGKKNEATEFHNIVLWGRPAEVVKQFCTKGSELMVEGRITTRTWDDKQGAKHYITEIVGENIQLGGRPGGGGKAAETEVEVVEGLRSGDADQMKPEELPF
jgi:single stranded DNA-binding protein